MLNKRRDQESMPNGRWYRCAGGSMGRPKQHRFDLSAAIACIQMPRYLPALVLPVASESFETMQSEHLKANDWILCSISSRKFRQRL